ncbi:Uncharacterized protein APZ42_004612, partial [Daphnia magna]
QTLMKLLDHKKIRQQYRQISVLSLISKQWEEEREIRGPQADICQQRPFKMGVQAMRVMTVLACMGLLNPQLSRQSSLPLRFRLA